MKKTVVIIGYPLGHTLSPAMHRAAFLQLGMDWEYLPLEVPPQELTQAINDLRADHIAGFNVTIPHKEKILPLLEDVSLQAKKIGAVNTVVNLAGRLIGYNTDGSGFIASLKEDAGMDPAGKTAVILGAGGASRAVSTMLLEAGAKLILISDVETEKARALSANLLKLFPHQCQFLALDSQAVRKALENSDLLINASPVGMHPHTTNSPLPEGITPPSSLFVYDLVYNPRETALLQKAKSAGCKTCGGLGMLVQQGALAFTLWTGLPAPVAVMRQAAEEALSLS